MPTPKKKRRLLRVERLETRTVPSPIHGLEVQALTSLDSAALTPDLAGGQAQPVPNLPAAAAVMDSSHDDHAGQMQTESHSHSDANPEASQDLQDQNDETAHPEGDKSPSTTDASETENHDGNTRTENENNSDGSSGSTQVSGDQNGDTSNAETNHTTSQANSDHDQSARTSVSTDDSNKDAADHSGKKNSSAGDSDHAKTPDNITDSVSHATGNSNSSGDSDSSSHGSGSNGDGVISISSSDQASSVQPTGKADDSDDLGSDGASHSKTNDHKESSSTSSSSSEHLVSNSAAESHPSSANDQGINHGTLRTDSDSSAAKNSPIALGSGTSGILLDAAPLAASLAAQILPTGTDSLLPDVPRLADTAAEVMHTGLDALATPIGIGDVAALETLPVTAYDLLIGFLPVDQESLDQAMQGFLSRVENLGEQLTGSEAGAWIYPVVLTILVATHVVLRRRKRSPKQHIWTVDRGSWMGNWFPSLSTLQK